MFFPMFSPCFSHVFSHVFPMFFSHVFSHVFPMFFPCFSHWNLRLLRGFPTFDDTRGWHPISSPLASLEAKLCGEMPLGGVTGVTSPVALRGFVASDIVGFGLVSTWWLTPLSKWVITPLINGISRVNPLITGVITHLLSGMSHQVASGKRLHSYGKSPCSIGKWTIHEPFSIAILT